MRLLTGSLSAPVAAVHVIPHPTTRPTQETATAEDLRIRFGLGNARLLLAFGFIHIDKGLDDLVRALAILRSSATTPLNDVRLVVAGTIRTRQGIFRCFEVRDWLHLRRVQRLIRRNELQQHVIFTGYVPDGEIAGWFLASAAVVLPYRRADQSGVASLASTFDALVLASTVGGLGEQFCDSTRTFAPGDLTGLARVLTDFLAVPSPELLERPAAMRADDVAAVSASTQVVYRAAISRNARRVSSASRA